MFQERAAWLETLEIRPYVYIREEHQIVRPGSVHKLSWFNFDPIFLDPFRAKDVKFSEHIYHLENTAFGPSSMAMPRWVFYDCALVPGFVTGFAARYGSLPENIKKRLLQAKDGEWVPLSLFILIPSIGEGEWVAHNLCSINSMLDQEDKLPGLGFLTKAFGLWYANVQTCVGVTQWKSPAIKLHSRYGWFEILTAYTPVHSYAHTFTYRSVVDAGCWEYYFMKTGNERFEKYFDRTELLVDPKTDKSLNEFQRLLERKEGPFFLRAKEIGEKSLDAPLTIYKQKER